MSVTIDIIDGSEIRQSRDGFEATRRALVDNLTGSAAGRMYAALLQAGVPTYGEPHPSVPGIVCVERNARAVDSGIVEVDLVYRFPKAEDTQPNDTQKPVITVGSTLQSETVDKDVEGAFIFTTHEFDSNHPNVELQGVKDLQRHDVDRQMPYMTLIFSRRELNHPMEKAKTYNGRVNRFPYLGLPARTLLCRIEGTSTDGGETYDVTYELQYNPSTWDITITHIDPYDDRPVLEPVEGKGRYTFRVQDEISFDPLQLSL